MKVILPVAAGARLGWLPVVDASRRFAIRAAILLLAAKVTTTSNIIINMPMCDVNDGRGNPDTASGRPNSNSCHSRVPRDFRWPQAEIQIFSFVMVSGRKKDSSCDQQECQWDAGTTSQMRRAAMTLPDAENVHIPPPIARHPSGVQINGLNRTVLDQEVKVATLNRYVVEEYRNFKRPFSRVVTLSADGGAVKQAAVR